MKKKKSKTKKNQGPFDDSLCVGDVLDIPSLLLLYAFDFNFFFIILISGALTITKYDYTNQYDHMS